MPAEISVGQCPAYVLAGGNSRRFGSSKARVVIDGELQLARVMHSLAVTSRSVHVVSDRADRFEDMGVSSIVDHLPDAGPMSGLLAAVLHARDTSSAGWLLLVSCDQFLWREAWAEQLAAGMDSSTTAATFVACGMIQPLPGLFHASIADCLLGSLRGDRRSLRRWLDESPGFRGCTSDAPPSEWSFNTPEQLEGLRTRELPD